MNQAGVGLGLTICKRICECMNGSVIVSSQVDKGSTFTMEIEIQDIKTASKPPPTQPMIYNELYNNVPDDAQDYESETRQMNFNEFTLATTIINKDTLHQTSLSDDQLFDNPSWDTLITGQ